MNNIFKSTGVRRITLDKKFYLAPDKNYGLMLTQEVVKIRKKVDKESRKPTGEEEEYIATEKYYFTKLSQAVNKYIQLSGNEATSIEELKEILLRIENTIETKLIYDFK